MRDYDEALIITDGAATTRVKPFRRHHRSPDRQLAAIEPELEG